MIGCMDADNMDWIHEKKLYLNRLYKSLLSDRVIHK